MNHLTPNTEVDELTDAELIEILGSVEEKQEPTPEETQAAKDRVRAALKERPLVNTGR